jgi:hypothetical protein
VESAILRCLQKDPAKRPPSVRQLIKYQPQRVDIAANAGLALSNLFWCHVGTFFLALALFSLFLFRVLLRKEWAAAVAWVLLPTVLAAADSRIDPVAPVGMLIFASLAVFVMIRFGLLALVANFVVYNIVQN